MAFVAPTINSILDWMIVIVFILLLFEIVRFFFPPGTGLSHKWPGKAATKTRGFIVDKVTKWRDEKEVKAAEKRAKKYAVAEFAVLKDVEKAIKAAKTDADKIEDTDLKKKVGKALRNEDRTERRFTSRLKTFLRALGKLEVAYPGSASQFDDVKNKVLTYNNEVIKLMANGRQFDTILNAKIPDVFVNLDYKKDTLLKVIGEVEDAEYGILTQFKRIEHLLKKLEAEEAAKK